MSCFVSDAEKVIDLRTEGCVPDVADLLPSKSVYAVIGSQVFKGVVAIRAGVEELLLRDVARVG